MTDGLWRALSETHRDCLLLLEIIDFETGKQLNLTVYGIGAEWEKVQVKELEE